MDTTKSTIKSYRPVLTNRINQPFGANESCAKVDVQGNAHRPFVIRTKIGNTCDVGYRDFYKLLGMRGHSGTDFAAWHGEPVYFADEFDGWMKTEHDPDGGLGVDIVSNTPIMPCTEPNCHEVHYIKRRHWHGLQVIGWDGKQVKMGDVVMLADSSGASSGDHLHTALKWCDKEGKGIHTDNGYVGAFPDTDFENVFIGDVVKIHKEALNAIQMANKVIFQVKMLLKIL